jgi:hypothetical protein
LPEVRRKAVRALLATLGLAFAAAATTPAHAQDLTLLYSQAELVRAAQRYSPNLRALWGEDFLSRLTPSERRLAGAVTLRLPLVGAHGTPLDIYADPSSRQVYLPISSVKFLDDIFIAMAYYDSRGCGLGSVSDYVAALREQPGAFRGSPRAALGIPADALDDRGVDDVAQKLLKSSIYFAMAHEYAHVMYRHRGYQSITAQEARQQEIQADAFALEIMRRIAVPPVSMAHFFLLASRLEYSPGDFDTAQEYEVYLRQRATHPVGAQRILAVADFMERNVKSFVRLQHDPIVWERRLLVTAGQLREIGRTLDDRSMRRFLAERARTMAPAALRVACRP